MMVCASRRNLTMDAIAKPHVTFLFNKADHGWTGAMDQPMYKI